MKVGTLSERRGGIKVSAEGQIPLLRLLSRNSLSIKLISVKITL